MSMGVSGDSISRERGSRRAKCTTVVEAGRGLAGAAVPSACASSSCASDQGSACSVLSGRHERRSGPFGSACVDLRAWVAAAVRFVAHEGRFKLGTLQPKSVGLDKSALGFGMNARRARLAARSLALRPALAGLAAHGPARPRRARHDGCWLLGRLRPQPRLAVLLSSSVSKCVPFQTPPLVVSDLFPWLQHPDRRLLLPTSRMKSVSFRSERCRSRRNRPS
jgi:hypothetical protein